MTAALLALILICSNTAAQALPASVDLLGKMATTIKSNPAMELSFEMVAKDSDGFVSGNFKGTVQAQGQSFRLINPMLEIHCDGLSKWILNNETGELTIFPNDTTQADLIENPVGFLTTLNNGNNSYSYSSKAKEGLSPHSGKGLWYVELTPKARHTPYKSIVIGIEKESSLPASIEYISTDGSNYTIIITKLTKMPLWPDNYFRFPKERTNGLIVTDLR